jgi:hypothetical protein
MTPGMKSTEFWLTLATMAMVIANGTAFINIPWDTLLVLAGGNGAYALSRGLAKRP